MASPKPKAKIVLKSISDVQRARRERIAVAALQGLLASRAQHPLGALQEQADAFAKTAVALADALAKELEKG